MNLRIFFNPLSEQSAESETHPNSFRQNIEVHYDSFPLWPDADLALIGICDAEGNAAAADAVRAQLYSLRRLSNHRLRIADLGNLRPGINTEESHLRLGEVCAALQNRQTIPVIIGGAHHFTLGQTYGFPVSQHIHPVVIDSMPDLEDNSVSTYSRNFLTTLLSSENHPVSTFSLLGWQSYLTDREHINFMERKYFNSMRLGRLRAELEEAEPYLRDADMLSFDMSAVRVQDAPGSPNSKPFGLSGEEACQLCRYAGLAHNLASLGIYEYLPETDTKAQTAFLIATMLWYFAEGRADRLALPDMEAQHFERQSLPAGGGPDELVFIENTLNGQRYIVLEEKPLRLLACSYSDYIAVLNGDLPDRFINAIARGR